MYVQQVLLAVRLAAFKHGGSGKDAASSDAVAPTTSALPEMKSVVTTVSGTRKDGFRGGTAEKEEENGIKVR